MVAFSSWTITQCWFWRIPPSRSLRCSTNCRRRPVSRSGTIRRLSRRPRKMPQSSSTGRDRERCCAKCLRCARTCGGCTTRSPGLDGMLFPELVAHHVPLTNGSGVFSPSLGEFALGAILYFAKDFRRLVKQPDGRRVGTIRYHHDRGADGWNRGLWRYRPRGGHARRRHGDAGPGSETPRAAAVQRGSAGGPDL